MMYPFMTLSDGTEIVHSEMKPDGRVKVYVEKPDDEAFFRNAVCWLPGYQWEDNHGFTGEELERYEEVIRSTAHLILEFSQCGGFAHASNL
ncbi:MAG: hypothetical protein LUE21_10400 [Oscillospiraceae bacterium]|nr:hypothetical protein [Oscillospiraceae bacterium]